MSNKRVFKTKSFDRWAKKVIRDDLLCAAAREIEQGRYEADLGGGVCKKRIALPGRGKSGSVRALVAKGHKSALFFLAGRQKGDPGADFSAEEEEVAKIVARSLHSADTATLNRMRTDGVLKEICNDQENG
jgi:hypothetical protein